MTTKHRAWIGGLTGVLFIVVGLSGVAMLLHLRNSVLNTAHEWAGLAFALAAVGHLFQELGNRIYDLDLHPPKLVGELADAIATGRNIGAARIAGHHLDSRHFTHRHHDHRRADFHLDPGGCGLQLLDFILQRFFCRGRGRQLGDRYLRHRLLLERQQFCFVGHDYRRGERHRLVPRHNRAIGKCGSDERTEEEAEVVGDPATARLIEARYRPHLG